TSVRGDLSEAVRLISFFHNSIPVRGRCKVTQQPDEVAYIPKTPAWVQGPTTVGGGATARKGAGRSRLQEKRHAARLCHAGNNTRILQEMVIMPLDWGPCLSESFGYDVLAEATIEKIHCRTLF